MNQALKNILIDLITPACVLALALFLRPLLPSIEIAQTSVFAYFPFVVFAASILLSWKFHQLNSLYFGIMLSVVYFAILQVNTGTENTFDSQLYLISAAIFLPLNFIIFRLWSIASVFSAAGFFRISLVAVQVYVIFWAVGQQYQPLLDVFSFQFIGNVNFISENIPQAAVLLFSIAILIQCIYIGIYQKPLDSTLLGALITAFIAFLFNEQTLIFFVTFSAAATMLGLATVQASYNMAFVDTLTGLPSRRAMEAELKKLGRRYTIAMLDIDHFKKLNDNYGHDVGDQVLRMVAKHIRRVGGGGRPARYGGEEFAVIFPNRSNVDVIPFLEVVRGNIANASFALRDKDRPKEIPKTRSKRKKPVNEISVTISIGCAEKNRILKNPEDVMKAADDALYKAKKQGRNRTCQ